MLSTVVGYTVSEYIWPVCWCWLQWCGISECICPVCWCWVQWWGISECILPVCWCWVQWWGISEYRTVHMTCMLMLSTVVGYRWVHLTWMMMLSTVVGYSWQALMRRMMWMGSQEMANAIVTVVTSFTTRFRFWSQKKIIQTSNSSESLPVRSTRLVLQHLRFFVLKPSKFHW